MNGSLRFACSIIAIALAAASARAGEVPIDISALANAPWSFQLLNPSTFRIGSVNLGGLLPSLC